MLQTVHEFIRAGESRFPATLRILRAHWGVSTCAPLPADISRASLCLIFQACTEENNVLATYRQALEADTLNTERGFTSLARAAREMLLSPDVTFSALAADSPLMTGNLDKSFLDSLRYGLLPFASWTAIAVSQAHVPSLTPEHMALIDALQSGTLPTLDNTAQLVRLTSTVRTNLTFLRMVSVPFDHGTVVRPLASCLIDASPSPLDAVLWAPARAAAMGIAGDWGIGLITAESAATRLLDLLESSLRKRAHLATGVAMVSSPETSPSRDRPPLGAGRASVCPSPSSVFSEGVPNSVTPLSTLTPPSTDFPLMEKEHPSLIPAEALAVYASRAKVACAITSRPGRRERVCHHAALADTATIHRRFGVQNENVFRALSSSARGVKPLAPRDLARFVTGASSRASTHRTAIRREAVPGPPLASGVAASLDLTHSFEPDIDGHVCAAIFMDLATWNVWMGPMKDRSGAEFIRVLRLYQDFVRDNFGVELRKVRADNDPCFTDTHGINRNTVELQTYLRSLPVAKSLVFEHSAPYTQSLNPVESAVRQLYHLMNFFLMAGSLSALCWVDMARAAVYVMNRLPHPQSKDRARRVQSAFELMTGAKPDLSDMIAGPGELVVVDRVGAKANLGKNTGQFCYFICPHEGGWLVRSFESDQHIVTHDVRKLSAPGAEISSLISLRHAIHTGMFRDGSGLAGAPATAVASGCLSLLADEVRHGGDADPNQSSSCSTLPQVNRFALFAPVAKVSTCWLNRTALIAPRALTRPHTRL